MVKKTKKKNTNIRYKYFNEPIMLHNFYVLNILRDINMDIIYL